MMNQPLFISLIISLGLSYLLLGFKASSCATQKEDYLLGGRSLGFWALSTTILATQLGGGTLLGSAEEAYLHGWSVLFYPMGGCLGLIALASGFGAKLRKRHLHTVSEIFEETYQSQSLRTYSAILSITSLFLILTAQGIATQKFLESLQLNTPLIFFGFWTILIVYTSIGGLNAVVNTDIIQTLFILSAIVITLFAITTGSESVIEPNFTLSEEVQGNSNIPWLSWLMMPFMFMFIEQDMGQRCFAADRPRTVTLATGFAALVMLAATATPIALGVYARSRGLIVLPGESVLLSSITQLTGPSVTSIAAAAILMALISTADSLLCSITSNLSYDIPSLSSLHDKTKGWFSQIMTAMIGIAAMALSYALSNIVQTLMFAYEMVVSVLFFPIIFSFFVQKPSKKAASISTLCSTFLFTLFYFFIDLETVRPLATLTVSLITFLSIQYFSPFRDRT